MQKNMVHGFPLLELRTMFPFIYFVLIALLLWILYSNLKSVKKKDFYKINDRKKNSFMKYGSYHSPNDMLLKLAKITS